MSLTAAAGWRRVLVAGVAAGAAISVAAAGGLHARAASGAPRATEPDVSNVPAGSLRDAALMAAPSIVSVDAEITGSLHDSSTGQDKMYDLGFGGTGFFASSDGYVVTAAHIVAPTDEQIHVDFVDQRIDEEQHCTKTTTDSCRSVEDQYEPQLLSRTSVQNAHVTVYVQTQDMSSDNLGLRATIAASSPSGEKDLAVLKVQAQDAPVLVLGQPAASAGTPVAIEGYPESKQDAPDPLIPTVTAGRVTDTRQGDAGFAAAATVVETDAHIEHGNSGGPGIDDKGAVVGIVSYGPSSGRNYLISAQDIAGLLSTTPASNRLGHADQLWRDGLTAQASGDGAAGTRDFADCSALGSIEVGCRARAGLLGTPQGPSAQNGGGVLPASGAVADISGAQAAEWMGGGIAIGLLIGAAATLLLARVLPRRGLPAGSPAGWGQQPAAGGWSWRWGPNGWILVPGSGWGQQGGWGSQASGWGAQHTGQGVANPWGTQPGANPWATQPVANPWATQPVRAVDQAMPPAEPPVAPPPPESNTPTA